MMPDLPGSGWGAPGRAMVQLGQSIASVGGDLADIAGGSAADPEADFNDKMIMLKTDNDVGLNEIQAQTTYSGTGDDYLTNRSEFYNTTTQDAISRISPRNQQKAAVFFEQRRGSFIEGAARFGGQRRQETLQTTIDEAVTTEYGKLATVPPEEFESQFKQTVVGVDAIIKNAPLPDTLKDKLAGQAAERGYQILNGMIEDPDTAPEIVPRILKMIEEPAPTLEPVAPDQVQPVPTGDTSVPDAATQVPGLPGSPSGPAPQKLGAGDVAPQLGQGSVAQSEPLAFETPSLTRSVGRARSGKVAGLVVHETQGSDTIDGNTSWSNKKNTGANYYIDKQGKIFQWAPDDVTMNHAGKGRGVKGDLRPDLLNDNTLAIEILTKPGEKPNDMQHQAAARLIAAKAAEYGLKPQDIEAHGRLAPGHKEATEGVSVVDYARSAWGGAAPAQSAVASTSELKPTLTAYSPQKAGDAMEGGYAAARPGPDGKAEVRTLADVAAGRSKYITLAGDKSQFGKEYVIPQITYRDAKGERVTLRNVKAVVHDTGSAFKGKGDQRFDIPVDRDLPSKSLGSQPFSKQQIAFIPSDQAGQGGPAPVAQRGITQYAGLNKLGAGDVESAGRAPNTIPGGQQQGGPVQVADASGQFVPQAAPQAQPLKPQTWRSVDQQLKGLLIKNLGHIRQQEAQAARKAAQIAEEKTTIARKGAEREGLELLFSRKLTRQWVQDNGPLLSNESYSRLMGAVTPKATSTNPVIYTELLERADEKPEDVITEASDAYATGQLDQDSFERVYSKASKAMRAETKRPPWALEYRSMVKRAIRPEPGDKTEDNMKAYGDTLEKFDEFLDEQKAAGKEMDRKSVQAFAEQTVKEFKMDQVTIKRKALGMPRFSQVSREAMTSEEIDQAIKRTLEAHKSGKIRQEELSLEAANLRKWKETLEAEAVAKGEKIKPGTKPAPAKPQARPPQAPSGAEDLGGEPN
jgi:hypothetical protein